MRFCNSSHQRPAFLSTTSPVISSWLNPSLIPTCEFHVSVFLLLLLFSFLNFTNSERDQDKLVADGREFFEDDKDQDGKGKPNETSGEPPMEVDG